MFVMIYVSRRDGSLLSPFGYTIFSKRAWAKESDDLFSYAFRTKDEAIREASKLSGIFSIYEAMVKSTDKKPIKINAVHVDGVKLIRQLTPPMESYRMRRELLNEDED